MSSECGSSTCGRLAMCGLSLYRAYMYVHGGGGGVKPGFVIATRIAGLCRVPDDVYGV